ncbi:hypothetical protein SAMN05216431_1079 [Ligilactobacillus sp. WC1T17]|uniref:Uncharacterized protein n=1 Tax=Ligilactobacillus ruminis TaxID=1623 RepID=A0ABY1ABS8_9LACO|nr:hypothetical protein SAMN05216431_1079 [Ligilactobacillus ruminis]
MSRDYAKLLDDLKAGKIDSFEISKEEFMDFQPVFMESNFRKRVIGEAKRGGGATYHYDRDGQGI